MSSVFWPIVVVGAFLVWIVLVAVDLKVPAFLAKWYKEPGNSIRALTWVGSLFIVLLTLTSDPNSFLGSLRTDAITVAVTVIVIEELGRYRIELEEKERIIRQMASRGNDFALDALGQVVENGWDKDGSLCERNLRNANLAGANLKYANLISVNIGYANLINADLWETDLAGANLMGANLQGANLVGANLQGAILVGANLTNAILVNADLTNAILVNADLINADLWYTNLTNAILVGAYLIDADLGHASLTSATLDGADLSGARYTAETLWPEGFDPKAAGAILVGLDSISKGWIRI